MTTSPTILVTGATDGIGKQTALEIARSGATVLLHGRNETRGRAALEEIERETGNASLFYYNADFSDLESVRGLASTLCAQHPRIDVVINNAGVIMNRLDRTEDGYEKTFAVNHLAPFLLTRLLLRDANGNAPRRIVNVSSIAHTRARLDFENLNAEREFVPYGAYAMSKLANVLFTHYLARQVNPSTTTVNALHPGVITTKLLREGFNATGGTVAEGAATSVHLALSPVVEGVTGKYFANKQEVASSPLSRDPEVQKRMWERSEQFLARYLND